MRMTRRRRLARSADRLARPLVITLMLSLRTGSYPEWRLSAQAPPAWVLVVGDPVIPIDRTR